MGLFVLVVEDLFLSFSLVRPTRDVSVSLPEA